MNERIFMDIELTADEAEVLFALLRKVRQQAGDFD
jgi:hypothetical protein